MLEWIHSYFPGWDLLLGAAIAFLIPYSLSKFFEWMASHW